MQAWLGAQALAVLLPLLAAAGVAFIPRAEAASWVVIAASLGTFALTWRLPGADAGTLMLNDALSAHVSILTAFVGVMTAWFSRFHMLRELGADRIGERAMRQYHALFLAFLGFMLLALLADNLGVAWVAIEAATITGVLVVALSRTPGALEAAWKYFVLCGVGVAMALFGVIVVYLAALPATGPGLPAMSWTALAAAAPRVHAPLLNLAFVFLLVGYGTKAGLAPLHSWLADAHAEGPTPVSAVLSGSVLNVALVVILRLRGLLAANPAAMAPGPPIMLLGLLSVLLAAFGLWRRGDIKRFFALSSIEQNGLVAVAFGLGGSVAVFAGVLHMTLHTLAKAAIYQCVGHVSQIKASQRLRDIGGLVAGHRLLALTLGAAIVAVAGLPPFGLFTSGFLILTEAVRRAPLLALPLCLGLLVGIWALLARLIGLLDAPATPDRGPAVPPRALLPAWLLLAVVLAAGLAMPGPLGAWLHGIGNLYP